jgi:hypothetical protein
MNIRVLGDLHKDITGENRAGGLADYPLTPDIYPPLGKINRKGYFRVHGPQKLYIFFLCPCFYLYRVIIHPLRIPGMTPIVNVGSYRMVRSTALLGALFFAVLIGPLPSATLNFLVVEAGSIEESPPEESPDGQSSVGEGSPPVSPVPFESSALWETCLLDVFFEAGHVVSNSPILHLSGIGAADFPGRDDPGGEFPRGVRPELDDAILGGADYLILVLLSYPPTSDPRTKPEEVNLRIYSLKPAGGRNVRGFVYEGSASLGNPRENRSAETAPAGAAPAGAVPAGAGPGNGRPAGGEVERDRAKRLIRGLIPHIKD